MRAENRAEMRKRRGSRWKGVIMVDVFGSDERW